MSVMWPDDTDFEAAEYDDSDAEAYDDSNGEAYDDAESPSAAARQRREQQRRIALARRRQVQARSRPAFRSPPAVRPAPAPHRETVAAIRNVDLDSKVQGDTLRSMIAAQNRRMTRGEWAAVAGAATGQFIESFDEPDNPYFRAAFRFAPLLLLAPRKTGTGLESFARDPRVIGAAAVAAITFAGDHHQRAADVQTIEILGSNAVAVGTNAQLIADLFDANGKLLNKDITWVSDTPAFATVDKDGQVTGVAQGEAFISATVDGRTRHFQITIN